MMPYTHVLYHANCYDGFGAAWAVHRLHARTARMATIDGSPSPPEPTYVPVTHGDEPPDLPVDARVLIADFSYPREQLLELHSAVEDLRVLDHHKTAEAALADLDFAEFDLDESGATLTWKHLHTDPVPEFVEYLRDRDLWLFDLDKSREVSAALRAYPMEFSVWDDLATTAGVGRLMAEGVSILRHQAQMVDVMCKQAVAVEVGGHEVPVVNATVFFSEVGDRLCELYPDHPFAAYYLDRADGKRQWGLRSRGGFDCSEVAKAYGGGGHPAAAGFVTMVPTIL